MKKFLLFLILVLTLCISPAVLAAGNITSITFTAPPASDSLRGTVTFGASWAGSDTVGNISFYNNVNQTENQFLCALTDLTAPDGSGTCTASTTGITDDCNGRTIRATLQNISMGSLNSTINGTRTGIIFDNTNSTLTVFTSDFVSSRQEVFYQHAYSFTSTDVCDTSLTNYVELTKEGGTKVNKTGTSGTWRDTDVDTIGSYTARAVAMDNAGGKDESTLTFDVGGKERPDRTVVLTTQEAPASGFKGVNLQLAGLIALISVVVIVIGGIVMWMVYFRN